MALIIKTVKQSGGNYSSFAVAEIGIRMSADNIAGNYIIVVADDFKQTERLVVGAGWNVDCLEFRNTKESLYNGTRGSGVSIICDVPGTVESVHIDTTVPVIIRNIEAKNIAENGLGFGTKSGNVYFINCLGDDTVFNFNIYNEDGKDVYLINPISYNGEIGIAISPHNGHCYIYNPTIISPDDAWTGIYASGNGEDVSFVTIINGYNGGSPSGFDYYKDAGTSTLNLINSYSSDGSLDTSVISVIDCHFRNIIKGSEDCHIDKMSALKGIGIDLHANSIFPFNADFEENIILNGEWSVGASQIFSYQQKMITDRINKNLDALFDTENDAIYKSLICDKNGITPSIIRKPSDINIGAITSQIEYLRLLSISLIDQLSIDTASGEYLKYQLENFFNSLKETDETDAEWVQRTVLTILQPKVSRAAIIFILRPYSHGGHEPEIGRVTDQYAYSDFSYSDIYQVDLVQYVLPAIASNWDSNYFTIKITLYGTTASEINIVYGILKKILAAGITYILDIKSI